MIEIALIVAFAVTVILMLAKPDSMGELATFAGLIGAALAAIYINDHGFGLPKQPPPLLQPRAPAGPPPQP